MYQTIVFSAYIAQPSMIRSNDESKFSKLAKNEGKNCYTITQNLHSLSFPYTITYARAPKTFIPFLALFENSEAFY